jgi:hypothetical protein
MRRQERRGRRNGVEMESHAPAVFEVPTRRTIWRIAVSAVAATVLLIAIVLGAYAVYHAKTSDISRLEGERTNLRSEVSGLEAQGRKLQAANLALHDQLDGTRVKLRKTNVKLVKATRNLTLANKNLTLAKKEPDAAEQGSHRREGTRRRELHRRLQRR